MLYQTTINMRDECIKTYGPITTEGLTENESVKHALDCYVAAGYLLAKMCSIETMAYEST